MRYFLPKRIWKIYRDIGKRFENLGISYYIEILLRKK